MDLAGGAARFGRELSDLLNGTITKGIRLNSILAYDVARVGYKISKNALVATEGIPVTLGRKPPVGFLGLGFRLVPDDQDRFLMVQSSVAGFFLDAEMDQALVHYDYERDKGDGYPEAHLQICADSAVWEALCNRAKLGDRPLAKLHFPVGGRRFRPTLEDLIDFLVTEKIADGHSKWRDKIDKGRAGFEEKQLRAAIRRNPDIALDQLRLMGKIT